MVFRNAIVLTQMSFGLIPKILDPIDVIMFVRKMRTMVNAIVLELRHIQGIVGTIKVRIDNTIRHHLFSDDGQKSLRFGIRDHLRVDLAAALQNAEDGHLAGSSPASFAFAPAPKVGLINFNGPSKCPFIFDLLRNDQSQPMGKSE